MWYIIFRDLSAPIILEEKLINYFLSWLYRVGYRVEYMVQSFSRFKSNEMVIRQQILFLWSSGTNVGAQTSCRRNAYSGSSAHAIQITSRYPVKHHNAKNMRVSVHDMLKNILNLTIIFEIISLASNRSHVELSVIYFPSNWVSISVLTT